MSTEKFESKRIKEIKDEKKYFEFFKIDQAKVNRYKEKQDIKDSQMKVDEDERNCKMVQS